MKDIKRCLVIFISMLLLYSIVQAAVGSLATNIITGGGAEGSFFNITALNEDIYITGFSTTLVGTANVRVYFKSGSYQGSENNAGAWRLLGSQTITGGSGFINTLYSVNIGGVTIPAGQTYGFLIYSGFAGTGTLAIRSRPSATASVSNNDIAIFSDTISAGGDAFTPFDGIFSPQAWRGVVHYAERAQFSDGRINRFDYAGAFVIYPHQDDTGDTGLIFYDWYNDDTRLLVVSATQIAAVPEFPEVNTLIAASADGRVALYRLTDGQFQAQGPTQNGKTYVVIFENLSSLAEYSSYEE
jgi:hypothetical protein